MRASPVDRLDAKITTGPGCWLWTAAKSDHGYGKFWLDGRLQEAHRVVYTLLVGAIPNGLQLDHLCRNRWCVNPDHLEPVTPGENTRRGAAGMHFSNKDHTHCQKGHAYPDPPWRDHKDRKSCLVCKRARSNVARDRKRSSDKDK